MLLLYFVYYFLIFMLGASFASFFGALAYRIESEMKYPDIFTRGSHCESCGRQLKWYELIPVLSYLTYRGKCSGCKKRIHIAYLGSEIIFGAVALLLYHFQVDAIIYVWVFSLGFLALYDALYSGVPKNVMHFYLGVGALWLLGRLLGNPELSLLYPAMIAFALFLFVEIVNRYKVVFGTGDTLLLLYLASISNLEVFLGTLFAAFIAGGIVALVLLVTKKVKRGGYIPFMPFIAVGYVSAVIMWSQGVSIFDYIYLLW